jgi:hypothetical protein
MIKKDLIVAVLATFCLSVTLFTILPTRSQTYDPWVDLDGDGRISIYDVVQMTSIFGKTGDPARNVTIAGRANKLAYSVEEQPISAGKTFSSPYISVDVYSKMTVSVAWLYGGEYVYNGYLLVTRHLNGTTHFRMDELTNVTHSVKTYDVPNQEILIMISNHDVAPGYFSLDVYLIP